MKKSIIALGLLISLSQLQAYDSTTYGGNSPYYNSTNNDYSNDRGENSQYYNSTNNDYSNDRGGNDMNYNAYDNRREEIYGESNSYRNSNGMIMNK